MQVNEAVSQAADEFLVMVSGAQDQVPVDSQHPQRVKQGDLLRDGFVRPRELVQDGPVEAVIDRIQWQPLRSSLGLEMWEILDLVKWKKTKTKPETVLFIHTWTFIRFIVYQTPCWVLGCRVINKKYKALAIIRFWAQETHKCDVRRWVLRLNKPHGEESCQPSWEWSSLPENMRKCQLGSVSYPQVLSRWLACPQNYTQKLPKTLVKTSSDILLPSYLRTFLWLTYKFILKFFGDMKEPLYHMLTTHDEGLPYLLHRVLNEIWSLCQTRQRHPRQALKWHCEGNRAPMDFVKIQLQEENTPLTANLHAL